MGFGDMGKDECPDGYESILDEAICAEGAQFLGHPFRNTKSRHFKGGPGAICTARGCTKTNNCPVGLSRLHHGIAKWVCIKTDKNLQNSAGKLAQLMKVIESLKARYAIGASRREARIKEYLASLGEEVQKSHRRVKLLAGKVAKLKKVEHLWECDNDAEAACQRSGRYRPRCKISGSYEAKESDLTEAPPSEAPPTEAPSTEAPPTEPIVVKAAPCRGNDCQSVAKCP